VELDATLVEANLVLSQVHDYLLDNVQALRFTYNALESSSIDSTYSSELIKRLASIYSRVGEVEKAIYLHDLLSQYPSYEQEALRLKFIPLASEGNIEELINLADRIMEADQDSSYRNLIMTHVWIERKDDKSIVNQYLTWTRVSAYDIDLLDHYIFMVAHMLRKNGHEKVANDWVGKLEKQIDVDDRYLQAQLLLFKGNKEKGLQLLDDVQIGWYNLSVCNINQLFENVSGDARYKSFIKRNADRMNDERVRISELESNSYLSVPYDFFRDQEKN